MTETMTKVMTEADALDAVRRTISGTVIAFEDPIDDRGARHPFLVGDRNADTLLAALHSAGWSWVPRQAPSPAAPPTGREPATAAQR